MDYETRQQLRRQISAARKRQIAERLPGPHADAAAEALLALDAVVERLAELHRRPGHVRKSHLAETPLPS